MNLITIFKEIILNIVVRFCCKDVFLSFFLSITGRFGIKKSIRKSLAFPYIRIKKKSQFQILLYHNVNDEMDPFFSAIPVNVFDMQMYLLSKFFTVLPLEIILAQLTKNDLPKNTIAITFDDGYKNNYQNAYPILKKYGLPATIFLTTAPIELNVPFWHDLVFDAFRRDKFDKIFIGRYSYPLRTLKEKRIVLDIVLKNLRTLSPQERNTKIESIRKKLGVSEPSLGTIARLLNWEDIEEMKRNNISFGAHTVTHPILTRMPLTEAVDEILESKDTIEKKLKSKVKLFAYPNGRREDFNESLKMALNEAGFIGGLTTIWGTNDIHTDRFELRRTQMWDQVPQLSLLRLGWNNFIS